MVDIEEIIKELLVELDNIQETQSKLDVVLLYDFSKSKQVELRGRINNPLPFYKDDSKSKSTNTKVLYNKKEVDMWFKNNF